MSSPADRPTAPPPRDYSLAAESPAGHLRQVLQTLAAVQAVGYPLMPEDVAAMRARVEAALAQLETR